ncbi:diguanylate cyclase domain-containing protein [Actinosynnema pretiosum]|uniref:Diguanylate cyclase n=2 Tax=Actinosynnema TaxID=40566 RepID=A0A290Z1U0_9PSEU|nr:diguanylate cyclase [Actinosynnema pretiosum]ATE52964.1 diguanylate cyclase [Actinosynnema pretiosum]
MVGAGSADPAAGRRELARAWARELKGVGLGPASPVELERFLLELVELLLDVLGALPFRAAGAAEAGRRLVGARFTGAEALRRTVLLLGRSLAEHADRPGPGSAGQVSAGQGSTGSGGPAPAERVVAVLAELSSGFAEALRLDALAQQEEVRLALLAARQRVERVLRLSEARFREAFDSSALGIAITDLRGMCVRANDSLARMLDEPKEVLVGRRLVELFHPDDAAPLGAAYRAVAVGRVDQFREQRRLVRVDGDPVWVHLAVSLLRDEDGSPAFHVTMAEDVSELHLLRRNLDHQLLHDALTGLSNRQHFTTRLEVMLRASRAGITLYQLDLDAFSVVNNGLGHATGDRVLVEVAHRLRGVVEREEALVARIGGDEFALVVDNSPTTPRVPAMVERVNAALAGPLESGVELSAAIGVVDRPASDWPVVDLLRAADSTVRRAKSLGARQWLPYDRAEEARSRELLGRAARLPRALAADEVEVEYQPVVDLATGERTGLLARVRWDGLGHEECAELAELGGSSPALGLWALERAAREAATWAGSVPLHVELSPALTADPDLVASVSRVLAETGLAPGGLRLRLHTRAALVAEDDNAQVLRDNGVTTGLWAFNGGQAELSLVDALEVDALVFEPAAARRLSGQAVEGLLHRAMDGLAAVVRAAGVEIVAPCVDSAQDLEWWRGAGATSGFGELFGGPVAGYEL